MGRISEAEFYNDKDVITQIEWLKEHIGAARLADVRLTQDTTVGSPTYGRVTMTFVMEDGTEYSRHFDNVAVTSITSQQVGEDLTITFHLANGQTYDVTCRITATATVAWNAITGTPESNAALTDRINDLAQAKTDTEKTRAEGVEGGLDTRLTAAEGTIANMITTLSNILYPVGSLYFTTKTENPSSYLGFGTWELYGAGRTFVCQSTSDTDYSTIGQIGGSKTVNITAANMPSHNHTIGNNGVHGHSAAVSGDGSHDHIIGLRNSGTGYALGSGEVAATNGSTSVGGGSHSHSVSIGDNGAHSHTCGNTGGNTPLDVKNPYIVVKVYRRTA